MHLGQIGKPDGRLTPKVELPTVAEAVALNHPVEHLRYVLGNPSYGVYWSLYGYDPETRTCHVYSSQHDMRGEVTLDELETICVLGDRVVVD